MKSFKGMHDADFHVDSDISIYGMITGSLVVDGCYIVNLFGMVCSDVIVSNGAKVSINGTVNNDVINNGGDVEIQGAVDGRVFAQSGKTLINKGARVNGQIIELRVDL